MPTLYFLQVALEAGIKPTIPSLIQAFPLDRDWKDRTDFRRHLQNILGEQGYKRLYVLANKVALEQFLRADGAFIPAFNPQFFPLFVRRMSEKDRYALLWCDEESMAFVKAAMSLCDWLMVVHDVVVSADLFYPPAWCDVLMVKYVYVITSLFSFFRIESAVVVLHSFSIILLLLLRSKNDEAWMMWWGVVVASIINILQNKINIRV